MFRQLLMVDIQRKKIVIKSMLFSTIGTYPDGEFDDRLKWVKARGVLRVTFFDKHFLNNFLVLDSVLLTKSLMYPYKKMYDYKKYRLISLMFKKRHVYWYNDIVSRNTAIALLRFN